MSETETTRRPGTGLRPGYGAFDGVFTPTVLTILGVIMYLRTGWVVGNAGLLGAWLIIGLACGITACTGLALSSLTTNIRIGPGGAFSLISQSLGLEIGGSIGVPLYLAQILAVAMYIFGFREGWMWIFPNHPALVVDLVTFGIIFATAAVSTGFAFRIQFVIMGIIALSLVSVAAAVLTQPMDTPITWWGTFSGGAEDGAGGTSFWTVFAVFFPAATGVMAGANMSGELRDPRRSIPVGTMSAVALTTVVYFALAVWLAKVAPADDLRSNYTIMIDKAFWGPLVLAGLLGATFSSALASLVGGPRILQALGAHRTLPGGSWFAALRSGEPRNAMWLSGAIVLLALMLRDLNVIAPLITMFFLITYAMINVVILVEQSLGLVSYRPLLSIPRVVPLLGFTGCVFAMFIINAPASLTAVAVVLGIYAYLLSRRLQAPFGDVRSGLFVSFAEWAAKKTSVLPASEERTWKPNLLIPSEDPRELRGAYWFVHSLAFPRGSAKLVGLPTAGHTALLEERLPVLTEKFRSDGVFSDWTRIDADTFAHGVVGTMQALRGAFFRPNTLFLHLPRTPARDQDLTYILAKARTHRVGAILFSNHPTAGLGLEQSINLWYPGDRHGWDLAHHTVRLPAMNLGLLSAYVIQRNWTGQLRVMAAVTNPDERETALAYLRELVDLARLRATVHVYAGALEDLVAVAPQADLTCFDIPVDPDLDQMRRLVDLARSSCVFCQDSGAENALA